MLKIEDPARYTRLYGWHTPLYFFVARTDYTSGMWQFLDEVVGPRNRRKFPSVFAINNGAPLIVDGVPVLNSNRYHEYCNMMAVLQHLLGDWKTLPAPPQHAAMHPKLQKVQSPSHSVTVRCIP